MKKPFVKKVLSYIWEQHIESSSSEYNPQLTVSLVEGRYQLCTHNAIYSFEDKYANFTEAFRKMNLKEWPIRTVLLLGFGLGSIPYMLEKTFERKYEYTGIEIDEEVIRLASKYVLPYLESPINLVLNDALGFLHSTNEKFDLIAVDIFQDAKIPEKFEDPSFLDLLEECLEPNGILMFNRLSHTDEDKQLTSRYYREVFEKKFEEAEFISESGNWILINNRNILL